MGFMNKILGVGEVVETIGQAVKSTSEVFTANKTDEMKSNAQRFEAVNNQFAQEFEIAPTSGFEKFVNGLNRLPRPLLAFGTMGLFVYAMIEPIGFAERMVGLNTVPEPLWWLLGAIVGFYFGARELHYLRNPDLRQNVMPGTSRRLIESRKMKMPFSDSDSEDVTISSLDTSRINTENAAVKAWLDTVS